MPNTPGETPSPLNRRITDLADQLAILMTGTSRCDDITSGAPQGYSQQYHYNSYGHDPSDDPAPSAPSGNLPRVFADRDYRGASMELKAGTYDLVSPNAVGNDVISSVKVPTGFKVTLFVDPGFKGASKTFTTDTAYVGDDFNDKASSIKVEQI